MKIPLLAKLLSSVVCAGVAMSLAATARGNITLTTSTFPVDPLLTANGWIGVKLTLVAHDSGEHVIGMDFSSVNTANSFGVFGTIGISGPIEQRGTTRRGSGVYQNTPARVYDPEDPLSYQDSYWLVPDPPYIAAPVPPNENSNRANVISNAVSGYTGSPETDIPFTLTAAGIDYGVGSLMQQVAVVTGPDSQPTLDIAFVIVPINYIGTDGNVVGFFGGAPNLVTIKGVATNNADGVGVFAIDSVINVFPIPEPASVGILAVGGAELLRRRRRGGR